MGLYEWLLEERAEEERVRGAPLLPMRGQDIRVLARQLDNTSGRRPVYAADLSIMLRLINRGPRNSGEGMRLGILKAKYPKEYCELRAEKQGQQKLLQW